MKENSGKNLALTACLLDVLVYTIGVEGTRDQRETAMTPLEYRLAERLEGMTLNIVQYIHGHVVGRFADGWPVNRRGSFSLDTTIAKVVVSANEPFSEGFPCDI